MLRADPESYRNLLIEKLEDLQRGFDLGKTPILQEDTPRKLEAVGHILYEELFNPELRAAYRVFHKKVETVLITSDEPWIPWELVKPYDDGDPAALIDDDYLCLQFQLTRWLSGTSVPAGTFRVGRVGCVEAGKTSKGPELTEAARECEILGELAALHGAEAKILTGATAAELEALIEEGVDLLHIASHGEFDAERPDESELILKGPFGFRPSDLHGRLRTRIRRDRPLVFFNTCQLGQQGWTLTGLGGWAKRWVVDCQCGAFVGPQWAVKDSLAYTFARELYQELGAGKTLGQAALAARKATWGAARGRPTWSAFHVYGHPNASIRGQTRISTDDPLFDPPGAADEDAGRLPLPPSSFLGRDDDLRDVKKRILGPPEAGSRQAPVLLMTGWPGVGKTTMTTALANDPELRAGFPDGVLWTALDQSPSVLTELNSWCIALGSPGLSPRADVDQASRHLMDLLRERKVLLLVDDVWESAHAVPLLVGGPGCAMLVTSRLDAVAQELAPSPEAIYRLPLLSEDAALELLRSRAPRVVETHPEKCRILVEELEGLPLALHVAGRMLDEEDRLGWGVEELLEELREGRKLLAAAAPSDRTDLHSQTLPTLALLLAKSTERLPEEILERFAYLGVLAPKPATFPLETMQAMWRIDDPKPTVRRLVRRGLLEPVGAGRFRMHALLVAHARSLLDE